MSENSSSFPEEDQVSSTLESVHARTICANERTNVYNLQCMLCRNDFGALEGKVEASQVARFFPHQANLRIIEAAAKRMNVSSDKFHVNLHKVGNTSAASVGLALADALEKGMVKKGDYIALTGFGAGLTYGSVVMKWAY
ncbi:3-oxoacyl-[acyl-carrier-protein] synthase 3 [Fusobacterium necrophorum subsp. necrophorum]|nr:3-oxoacyl-[acyl-carrier-protein] synthase 3 [Fusobacterium necrophorum subsp. necrophorum]